MEVNMNSIVNNTIKEMNDFLFQNNIPVFGTANSEFLEKAPEGFRPSDMISNAKSVIAIGIPVPAGVFKCDKKRTETIWRTQNLYFRKLDSLVIELSNIIEKDGSVAVPVFGCYPMDLRPSIETEGYVNILKIAEVIGLGTIGKNGMIISSKYGPRLMLGGIVTSASLPETVFPERDNVNCPDDCCECQKKCPAKAISSNGEVNIAACIKYASKAPIFTHLLKANENDSIDINKLMNITAVDEHTMQICSECIISCPLI